MKTLIIFYYMLFIGDIKNIDINEDRTTYTLITKENCVYEYAYKEEIINYIKTGDFIYDDTLEPSVN